MTKNQIFSPDLPELSHIRAVKGINMEKSDFQEQGVILHSFYVQLTVINLVSGLNLEVWPKAKLLTPIGLNYALLEPSRAQIGRKHGSQESSVVLHSLYVQLLPINFVSSQN